MATRAKTSAAGPTALLLLVPLAPRAVLLDNWHRTIAHGLAPYDEVGIALNWHMLGLLRRWGCARITERFPRTLPPHGSASG